MRILYVTANLPFGTDEAFLIPEVDELLRLGHEVLIVPRSPTGRVVHGERFRSFAHCEQLWSRPALLAAVNSRWSRNLLTPLLRSRSKRMLLKNLAVLPKAARLAELAEEWKADHIHCHWAGTTATMAMFASQLSGIPWSFTLHRWDIVENNLLVEKARSASLVRFISEDGLRMAQSLGVPAARNVRVIHMGVVLPPRSGSRPEGRIVLCPARLVEVKGHGHLLRAWRKLRDRGVEAELWLAGDGPLRTSLESQAASLNLGTSVQFLGTVNHESLLQMYARCGIAAVVVPSLDLGNGCHEGIPVALIEAMSFGVPVIGTRAGGTSELIRTGCGLMVGPGDVDELATALTFALQHREECRRMAEQGRRYVENEFDVRSTVQELVLAFENSRRHKEESMNALAAR